MYILIPIIVVVVVVIIIIIAVCALACFLLGCFSADLWLVSCLAANFVLPVSIVTRTSRTIHKVRVGSSGSSTHAGS